MTTATPRTCAALSCRDRAGMTFSGRGQSISGRPPVGVQSAGGRHSKIITKSGTVRPYSKAGGLEQKTLFRQIKARDRNHILSHTARPLSWHH
ncbi:hypothetical protein ACP179_10205 [Xenorhabdus stockiae]|uniref:hypothetical protein n=1 Tax=Xenorhabdus stockiae TaxID=351614 RepID=UPI003CEAA574